MFMLTKVMMAATSNSRVFLCFFVLWLTNRQRFPMLFSLIDCMYIPRLALLPVAPGNCTCIYIYKHLIKFKISDVENLQFYCSHRDKNSHLATPHPESLCPACNNVFLYCLSFTWVHYQFIASTLTDFNFVK